jgi:uncharacterized membrane protein
MAVEKRVRILAWNHLIITILAILCAFDFIEWVRLLHSRCVAKVEGADIAGVEEGVVEEAAGKIAIADNGALSVAVLAKESRVELAAVLVRKVVDATDGRSRGFGG